MVQPDFLAETAGLAVITVQHSKPEMRVRYFLLTIAVKNRTSIASVIA